MMLNYTQETTHTDVPTDMVKTDNPLEEEL